MNDFELMKKRAGELREIINYHNKKYYENDEPEIEDFEYDRLLHELIAIEEKYPVRHFQNYFSPKDTVSDWHTTWHAFSRP